jgi:DNA-directed RNA polymerase alpha subunit
VEHLTQGKRMQISDLNFQQKVERTLAQNGFETVEALVRLPAIDVLKLPNIGYAQVPHSVV